jgi:tRNA(fMet)-specific endonuclease VapC
VLPRQAILDTDTLSAYMRREPIVVTHIEDYLITHVQISFSVMTRYEILRGLKARGATTKLKAFEELCMESDILPLTDEIIDRAADVYADLYRRGRLISEGDMLIAGTALVHNLVVITNNEKHFNRIMGLHIENWLEA